VILSWSSPDHPFQTALWKVRLGVTDLIDRFAEKFLGAAGRVNSRWVVPADEGYGPFAVVYPSTVASARVVGRRDSFVSSGCRPSLRGWEVVGQEVILNYPTTVAREGIAGGQGLLTIWMAPELSCFALRATIQAREPDGSWKLFSEKRTVNVTVNR